eukprot:s1265_g2.t1
MSRSRRSSSSCKAKEHEAPQAILGKRDSSFLDIESSALARRSSLVPRKIFLTLLGIDLCCPVRLRQLWCNLGTTSS